MKTVGEIVKTARIKNGLTLSELAERTKIQEHFLIALEESNLKRLPAMPFVKGFIRTVAAELNLDSEGMVAIFRRDFGSDKKGRIIPRDSLSEETKKFYFSPKLTVLSGGLIAFLAFGIYILFQLRGLVTAPRLEIIQPKDQTVVAEEAVVDGVTDPSATVSINGQEIRKNRNGSFSQTIRLPEGTYTINIVATGQNGKTTTIDRTVQVKK